jgi:hypothetical protein
MEYPAGVDSVTDQYQPYYYPNSTDDVIGGPREYPRLVWSVVKEGEQNPKNSEEDEESPDADARAPDILLLNYVSPQKLTRPLDLKI